MTTQATVSFDAELARQTKATEVAQALALHWQGVADAQRDEITGYKLMADEQQARWDNLAEHLTLEIDHRMQAQAERDQARAGIEAMRRTATNIADERSHIATELLDAQLDVDALSRQLAELTQLVGSDTPIAAMSLAETWYAEKAAYMERIAELEAAARAVCATIPDQPIGRSYGVVLVAVGALRHLEAMVS